MQGLRFLLLRDRGLSLPSALYEDGGDDGISPTQPFPTPMQDCELRGHDQRRHPWQLRPQRREHRHSDPPAQLPPRRDAPERLARHLRTSRTPIRSPSNPLNEMIKILFLTMPSAP